MRAIPMAGSCDRAPEVELATIRKHWPGVVPNAGVVLPGFPAALPHVSTVAADSVADASACQHRVAPQTLRVGEWCRKTGLGPTAGVSAAPTRGPVGPAPR